MKQSPSKFAAVFLLLCSGLAGSAPQLLAKKKIHENQASTAPNEQRRALHALNRLTFGARPGDLQQVLAIGVDKWIELQLHPEKIDDSALNARLEPFRTLRMSTKEIAQDFPNQQEINQVMNGKRSMPSDLTLRIIYEVQLQRLRDRKERKNEDAKAATSNNAEAVGNTLSVMPGSDAGAAKPLDEKPTDKEEPVRRPGGDARPEVQRLLGLPPQQRFDQLLSKRAAAQVKVVDSLRKNEAQEFLEGMDPRQKEILFALKNPVAIVGNELTQAKVFRAVYGQRQLDEVMTDFWINHFNVFLDKGLDHFAMTSYERDVIRPHALGKFEDLLVATAKSPAMLFYLDNWMSVGPNSAQAMGLPMRAGRVDRRRPPPRKNPGKRPSGLNENYGRELLELHTLSVNGGYSQRDVSETAKVFTGWTIDKPAEGGGFKFDPRMHEPGDKYVLGHRIKGKGEQEGRELLHQLASSPKTAHFISLKLAERFISDGPPPALVDRMAKTFLKKKGDIREVLSTMFHSPEFWDEKTYRAKVKTPLEFVASALRATGAEIDDAMPLTRQLNTMGMPLYGAQAPTGYSMKAETWVSSSALLNRMNFALALTNGKIKGVKIDSGRFLETDTTGADAGAMLTSLETELVGGGVSQQTHDLIAQQIAGPKGDNRARQPDDGAGIRNVNLISGLLLGSPEFQRR
jgi:uncharacterized protein (DUF1800 family)